MEHPYKDLRSKDYKKFVESKGQFAYLSWAKCLDLVKQIDPYLRYELVDLIDTGQSKVVHVRLYYFGDKVHDEYLAVRDYRNKAVANPDAAQVENTFRRAVAKAISMCFGYGIELWINEDIRDLDYVPESNNGVMPAKGKMTVDQRVKLDRLSRNKHLSNGQQMQVQTIMNDQSKTEQEIDELIVKVNNKIAANKDATRIKEENKDGVTK
tara:strand:- start:298 stop:927 length:630 start_codon:yes stop_codon:yes gene_type:complete